MLRRFLHFSEEAATRKGLLPQHHQLLLQIAGAPTGAGPSIGYLADRLTLRHHSVVELANRCEQAGLLTRRQNPDNRRQVLLGLTASGRSILNALSAAHACELNELGPHLIELLQRLTSTSRSPRKKTS